MSKVFSLIGFVVALVWTWNIVYSSNPSISTETHFNIQARLTEIIREQIAKKKPTASEITIQRLWTEKLSETKLRAVFAYRYKERLEGKEETEQHTEGEAVLFREPTEDRTAQKWILQSVKTTADQINFSEGLVISPGMKTDDLTSPVEGNSTTTTTSPDGSTTPTPATTGKSVEKPKVAPSTTTPTVTK